MRARQKAIGEAQEGHTYEQEIGIGNFQFMRAGSH
jgi:hypothetical protein